MIAAFFGSLRNYVPDFQLETPSTWTAPQIRAVAVVYVGHFRVLPDVQLQGPKPKHEKHVLCLKIEIGSQNGPCDPSRLTPKTSC